MRSSILRQRRTRLAYIYRAGQIYLIRFTPLAFAPECQYRPSRVPSLLVFLPISMHFTATLGIPPAPTVLEFGSFRRPYRVKPCHLTTDLSNHLRALYAQ